MPSLKGESNEDSKLLMFRKGKNNICPNAKYYFILGFLTAVHNSGNLHILMNEKSIFYFAFYERENFGMLKYALKAVLPLGSHINITINVLWIA